MDFGFDEPDQQTPTDDFPAAPAADFEVPSDGVDFFNDDSPAAPADIDDTNNTNADDVFGSPQPVAQLSGEEDQEQQQPQENDNSGDDFFAAQTADTPTTPTPTTPPPATTTTDDMDDFLNSPSQTEQQQQQQQPPVDDVFATQPSPVVSSPVASFDGPSSFAPPPENDLIRQYEQEHSNFLEEKAAESRKKEAEALERAQKELEAFYAERKERTAQARSENRAASEAVFDNAPETDKQAWENVSKFTDFQASAKEGATDLTRMKAVLIAAKHK